MTPDQFINLPGHWPWIFQWVFLAAAVITAFSVIWKKVVIPTKKACIYVSQGIQLTIVNHQILKEAAPLLKEISKEFKPNAGSTLKDQITRIEKNANTAVEVANTAVTEARKAAALANEVHEIVVHLKDR